MRILFTGGGTAGHINPALAVAGHARDHEKNIEILFIGSKGGMEERLVPQAGFELKTVPVSGFRRKLNMEGIKHNLKAIRQVFEASKASEKILREFKPDICVGTGGYVCGPILRKAKKMGIPVVVHEANAFPGVTIKMLCRYADKILLAVPDAEAKLGGNYHDKVVITGNPVRSEMLRADKAAARKKLGLDERPVVLSYGGSLGAEQVNRAVAELIARTAKTDAVQHIHAYGQYGKWFPSLLEEKGVKLAEHPNLDIREYINNMPDCAAAADLMICRAGAMSLTELQVLAKPAILIPSPNVAENHQYYNALALSSRGAAWLIEEKDLTGEKLSELAESLLADPEKLKQCSINAGKMAIVDANERIWREVKAVLAAQKK
ncbi:MAG: undecaprenyldiphospho-muramoylpentapeptide beta-N-acetylglucosaminyltransferase [Clostridia bacterium]|nr:undecaprenyldiphospho-muramoylpentapeptide beta-N-acetylglucosaminyltransferase [Clostridia bacterium]